MKKHFRITNSLRSRKCRGGGEPSSPSAPVINKSAVECKGCRIEVQWNEKEEAATVAILDSIGKDPWGEGGFTEKDFRSALKDIPRNKHLNLLINSRGGDVFEGFGIKNAIAEWPNRVTATITGVAASTASWMILDADEVRAPKASQMFIHEAMTMGAGNAADLREVADRLDTTSEQIAGFYAAKNGKSVNEMRELMKKNTLMTGAQAKELGLVDVLSDEAPTNNFTEAELTNMRTRLVMLNNLAPVQGATNTNNQAPKVNTMNEPTNTLPNAGTPPTAAPTAPATNDPRLIALENRLREAEVRNTTAEFNQLAATRPTINREEWLPKVIADPSLLNSLRAFPEAPEPAAFGAFNRIENKGNPLLEKFNNTFDVVEKSNIARSLFPEVRKQLLAANGFKDIEKGADRFNFNDPRILNANTVDAALANTILSGDFVTKMRTLIAPWAAWTRRVVPSPVSRRQTIEVPLVSTAGSMQTNATNYETGDSTLAPIAVTVAENARSWHMTRPQTNLGLELAALAPTNYQVLAEGLNTKMTALLVSGNYGAATAIGAASGFDSADLPAILALGKNYNRVTLVLDGGHLAYLLPTTREHFAFGEAGAFGFDGGIYKNNLWTSAEANTVGFVCGPDALVNAWGMADGLPAGEAISQASVDVNGIPFTLSVWFSRATREVWASVCVMHGCAVGDATQGEILVTS